MPTMRLLLSVLFVAFISLKSVGQYIVKGKVIGGEGSTPLSGVTISLDSKAVSMTDSNGIFELNTSEQKPLLQFSHIGFQTQSYKFGSASDSVIMMYRSNAFLAETVVKAFESNTSIKNIPVTIAVLGKKELERYGDVSILPAINTVPGVKMDERSPGSYRLSIRGNLLRSPFGVRNVKVYWNGIPFTDANGTTYLNEVGFSNVGKMEIIKGPGGSMYGAGTGGVLLLNSRVAGPDENSIAINTLAGSYGLVESNITYRRDTEHANYSLQYAHQQSDGWRDHTNTRRDVANYTGTFEVSKKQTISTNIFYSDLYYQTPGGLTSAQLMVNPRQARQAGGPFRSAAQQQAALFVKTLYAGFAQDYQFNADWSNTTSIYTAHTRFRNPSILNYQRKTEQGIGGRSVTQYHHNYLTIHFGGEYQYAFTSSRTFGNQSGVSDTLQFDDEIGATQYNIFLQTDIDLGKNFIINGGLSYNNYHYGFTRLNALPLSSINKTFDPVLIPRISLLKKISNRYILYATVSKGYSPPTIDEIVPSTGVFSSTLEAEKATNYEIGFRTEPIKSKLFIDVAAYYFNLNNTIVTRRDASGADYFVNTGKTEQKGYELSATYYAVRNMHSVLRELKFWSNYTHINATFKTYKQGSNDYSGKQLTGTPPNVFVLGADVVTKPGFYANITYSYTDMIPLNDANLFYGTQYNLLFARVGYKKDFSKLLQGEIYCTYDKSFNTPYGLGNDLNAAGNRFYNPSAPENFVGGIKLKFNL
ncbi:MAG: TonB-dependent receptor [Ferruginibacter sp.]